MHVYLGGHHWVRVTATKTRSRQILRYERLGATVVVDVVDNEQVPAGARLGALVDITEKPQR